VSPGARLRAAWIPVTLLAAGAWARPLPAQQTAGLENSAALFLLFPVGGQAVGMGQAAVALDGSAEAIFWNPAGLGTLTQSQFDFHTATLPAAATHAITAAFPSRNLGTIGAAVYLVDYGDFDRTDSSNNTLARISARNLELVASYATGFGSSFVLGVSYKLIEFRVDCSGDCVNFPNGDGLTHAIDVGGQFALGPAEALRLAFAVRNIGFPLQVQNRDQADPLPVRVVLGALYRIPLPGGGGGDPSTPNAPLGQRLDVKLALDVDSPWGSYGNSEMRVGADVGYGRLVRVRGGYAFLHDGLAGPSVGVGVTSGSLGIDLARMFLTNSDLVSSDPTYFSFRVEF